MSELITSIEDAYQNPDNEAAVNKAHRLFLGHEFILPVEKESSQSEPLALFFSEGENHFLPIFSEDKLFFDWAGDSISNMSWLHITGKDLILGTGQNAYLCLDVGHTHYKEFSPNEITKLKQVVLKLERIAKATSRA